MMRIGGCLARWLAVALLSIPALGHGEPKAWMERDNAQRLGLWVSAEGCPITDEELRPLVEEEFGRADIEPTGDSDFNLTVDLMCVEINVDEQRVGYGMSFDIRFGTGIYLYEFPNYGALIVAGDTNSGGDHFIASFKKGVRNALDDYRQANY